jgi:predicted nucleic acid-binding protein
MLVLDANILIRSVLGQRVRNLLEKYSACGVRFYSPLVCFADSAEYLPNLLTRKGRFDASVDTAIEFLQRIVQPVNPESYSMFEAEARRRLHLRDEDDWPVLALALALNCPIWTEDRDFFGTGCAIWTTIRVEIFLQSQRRPTSSESE